MCSSDLNQAIGHIKLADLRPQHLNSFYKNLSEPGIRMGGGSAKAKIDMVAWLKKNKLSRGKLAEKAGVSAATAGVAVKGESIKIEKAQAIAQAMEKKVDEVFKVEKNMEPLADKTILEHHRLISTILAQAENEMLVPYNAAAKATPPRTKKKDPNYFQPETISAILEALESEPLKWRLITHLLIVTGWLKDFSTRHGLPHINPHAFRHTVASVLLANGTDIVTVSKQLGHASITTTENFYSHIIEENKAKAAECIADVLIRKKA